MTNGFLMKWKNILNKQVTNEAWNAEIYLAYGAWADEKGMAGLANYLFRHAKEERNHMRKFMQRGGRMKIQTAKRSERLRKMLKQTVQSGS